MGNFNGYSEDEFKLILQHNRVYNYTLQALKAMESLQEKVQLISGGPDDKALELAKNHFSEYAAEALCALNDEILAHILQKGANS